MGSVFYEETAHFHVQTITETVVEVEEFDMNLFILSTSVCNCNRSGIELLEEKFD